jgi:hypothetical protein
VHGIGNHGGRTAHNAGNEFKDNEHHVDETAHQSDFVNLAFPLLTIHIINALNELARAKLSIFIQYRIQEANVFHGKAGSDFSSEPILRMMTARKRGASERPFAVIRLPLFISVCAIRCL